MRKDSKVKVTKVKSKELVLQYFVVFLKYTLEKGLVRELDLAMCVSPSLNGSKMRSLWTNQMKS